MVKNREDFLKESEKIFGKEYDYSLVVYKKSVIPVKIICKKHGVFSKKPNKHLQGQGCPICSKLKKGKRLSLDIFVQKAKEVHNDKYNYEKVKYKNNRSKVEIICPIHGSFWQRPNDHLMGHGCYECGKNKNIEKLRMTKEEFVEKSNRIHQNKYEYSLVNYVNNSTKVCIICPVHGEFWQRPIHHLNGCGCQECKKEKISLANVSSSFDFANKSYNLFGNKYSYAYVDYKNSKGKVCIVCPIHGEFWQRPNDHLMGHGCPKCNQSKGETQIEMWLKSNGIDFEYQKVFENCFNKSSLPFDFYLPDLNTCIEYDGIQHFEPTCFGGMDLYEATKNLNQVKENDEIKNSFCNLNNIKLIRISYFENLKEKLNSFIKEV